MIAVIDYGRGNMFSVGQALRYLGWDFSTVSRPEQLAGARCIILPGVGAFGDAMTALNSCGLVEPLRRQAREGVPFLGICLGMQVLADYGEEFGRHQGLGLIPGVVRRLESLQTGAEGSCRIPNVGWRRVNGRAGEFGAALDDGMFYFNHSYAMDTSDPTDVTATIVINGRVVPAAVTRGNVHGVQFHPEKSGPVGLRFLRRFLERDLAVASQPMTTP